MTVEQGLRAELHDRRKVLARALRAAREQGKLNETWRNILAAFIWRSTKEGHEYWLWTYTNSRNPDQYLPEGYVDVEESKEQSPWISVEDELPETNCDVLVAKNNGRVFQMSYHTPCDGGERRFQWWGRGEWIDQHSQVTHWMPLPKPPKP